MACQLACLCVLVSSWQKFIEGCTSSRFWWGRQRNQGWDVWQRYVPPCSTGVWEEASGSGWAGFRNSLCEWNTSLHAVSCSSFTIWSPFVYSMCREVAMEEVSLRVEACKWTFPSWLNLLVWYIACESIYSFYMCIYVHRIKGLNPRNGCSHRPPNQCTDFTFVYLCDTDISQLGLRRSFEA